MLGVAEQFQKRHRLLSKDLNNTFRRKASKISDCQAFSQLWTGY